MNLYCARSHLNTKWEILNGHVYGWGGMVDPPYQERGDGSHRLHPPNAMRYGVDVIWKLIWMEDKIWKCIRMKIQFANASWVPEYNSVVKGKRKNSQMHVCLKKMNKKCWITHGQVNVTFVCEEKKNKRFCSTTKLIDALPIYQETYVDTSTLLSISTLFYMVNRVIET